VTDDDPGRRVREALDALGARYRVLDCDPELADTQAFVAAYGFAPPQVLNTILVVSKRGPRVHAACVAPADARLDVNGAVRRELGAPKVSFASAEETAGLTGMALGGVAPFGLPADVPVLVDARVLEPDTVVVGGGSRAVKYLVDPEVFPRAPHTRVVEGLALQRLQS
jgi:prolyl-tRNA editing enzyme YbaK/EbsC (Cys-tRNA(Pro) deacylase)